MRPQDSLRQSADVFEERGRVYGDAYKNFGHVLMALRPNGFAIRTVEDANRLGVFVQILSKIVRYANQFEAGGHDDSLLDLSTYAAMLRELDAEGRARFEAPFPWERGAEERKPAPHLADEMRRETFVPKPGFPRGSSSVARGIGELMDRGDEIARKDPERWGGKVPCASFSVDPTDAHSRTDAIFSDPVRKATLDGFKVGPIEPEVEPVVPRRDGDTYRFSSRDRG